jgi:glycopeptide antibiotics resistance protein
MFRRHPILAVTTAAYVVLIGWLTLTPQPVAGQRSILWALVDLLERIPGADWVTFDRVEFLANILLFIPLGVLLTLLLGRSRWWVGIVAPIGMTLAIELAQRFIAGRVSDPRDLIANSLGAIVGALAALAIDAIGSRRTRRAPRTVG